MTLTPYIRIERLIILSRAGLASFAYLAGWLDPLEPASTAMLTQSILGGYLVYSWSLILILWALPLQTKTIGLVSHVLDVLTFTLLVALTQGSASPFFSYFVFALFAAALRWQKPGILWSALAFLCLFSGTGIFLELGMTLDSSGLELNRFIIRNVHLIVVSLLLIYLTAYEKKIRLELNKLSDWPPFNSLDNDLESFVFDTLSYAAVTLESPRIMMFWEETEEPVCYLALLESEHFSLQSMPPTAFNPIVPIAFADCHFLCNDIHQQRAKTLCVTGKGLKYLNHSPLHPDLIKQHPIQSVIGLVIQGQSFQGYLLLLDKPTQTVDDLNLGILAAQQVGLRMDQFLLHLKQQKNTAIEERIKMARDLHDGVLQTLTGIALQVKNISRTLESNPAATHQNLESLQAVIQTEQRHLRQFIQQLKPAAPETHTQASFNSRLQELADTIFQQWGLMVKIAQNPYFCPLSQIKDVYPLIREALVNCARHANASHVELQLHNTHNHLNILIVDDGQGFPFQGDYSLTELVEQNQGPKTIIERVVILRGNMQIHSQCNGTRIEINLPFPTTKSVNAANHLWSKPDDH